MHITLKEFDACVEAIRKTEFDLEEWDDEILGDIVAAVLKTIGVEIGL